MNLQTCFQYMGLITINCAEIHAVNSMIKPEWSHLTSLLLLTTTWSIYVEQTVGGILFRPNTQNNPTFQIRGVLNQMKWPLTDRYAWRPDFWDLNYYMVLVGSTGLYVNTRF